MKDTQYIHLGSGEGEETISMYVEEADAGTLQQHFKELRKSVYQQQAVAVLLHENVQVLVFGLISDFCLQLVFDPESSALSIRPRIFFVPKSKYPIGKTSGPELKHRYDLSPNQLILVLSNAALSEWLGYTVHSAIENKTMVPVNGVISIPETVRVKYALKHDRFRILRWVAAEYTGVPFDRPRILDVAIVIDVEGECEILGIPASHLEHVLEAHSDTKLVVNRLPKEPHYAIHTE